MSKLTRVIISVGMIIVGAVSDNWYLVAAGVTNLASTLMMPKMKGRQNTEENIQLGEQPRSALIGETMTGGTLVDIFNYGGKYGTEWTFRIIAIADHRCDALVGFYVNDKFVAYTGDGIVPGYKGQLKVYWRDGRWDQEVPADVLACAPVVGGVPTWTANDRGRGVAWVVVAFKADDPDAKKPVWTSGPPSFTWVVRGLRCYIARKDGSVGGDGSHRWDDPDTREWTDNLYDARYTWLRGIYAGDRVGEPEMLLLGRGLSAIEAPPANTFAPANLCDELVPLKAGGTEKRYRVSGTIKADEPYITTEDMFASACGGVIVEREGAVEIEPGQAKAAVWHITDDDLLVGGKVSRRDFPSRADDEWCNTVVPRYVEPKQKWTDHAAPVRRVIDDVIADGGPREKTVNLAFVSFGTQAQRVGEMVRRLGRLWLRRSITLPPRFAGAEHGDWLVWTSRRYGPSGETPVAVTYRIESDRLDEKWQNSLSLRQIGAAVYGWNAETDEIDDGAVAVQPPPPADIGAPEEGSWALASAVSAEGVRSLVFTGEVEDAAASHVIFEYADAVTAPDPEDDDAWSGAIERPASAVEHRFDGVADAPGYYGAVSYRVDGEVGDRLVLGPVSFTSLAPPPATLLTGAGGAGEAEIKWRNSTSALFDYSKVFRADAGEVFVDAVAVSGPLYGAPGEMRTPWADTVAAGDYLYWVVAYSAAGVASTPTGPLAVTVS